MWPIAFRLLWSYIAGYLPWSSELCYVQPSQLNDVVEREPLFAAWDVAELPLMQLLPVQIRLSESTTQGTLLPEMNGELSVEIDRERHRDRDIWQR